MDKAKVVEALRWAEYQAMVQRMHGSKEGAEREELFRTLAQRIEDGVITPIQVGMLVSGLPHFTEIMTIIWSDEGGE